MGFGVFIEQYFSTALLVPQFYYNVLSESTPNFIPMMFLLLQACQISTPERDLDLEKFRVDSLSCK